jgi:hypothetical protein
MKFTVTVLLPGLYLVVADQTGDVLGIFYSADQVERACERYRAAKKLVK